MFTDNSITVEFLIRNLLFVTQNNKEKNKWCPHDFFWHIQVDKHIMSMHLYVISKVHNCDALLSAKYLMHFEIYHGIVLIYHILKYSSSTSSTRNPFFIYTCRSYLCMYNQTQICASKEFPRIPDGRTCLIYSQICHGSWYSRM